MLTRSEKISLTNIKVWCRLKPSMSSLALMLALLMATFPIKVYSQEKLPALTAAYIYYFTKFVQWEDESKEKKICVVTSNTPLKNEFKKIATKARGAISFQFFNESHANALLPSDACDVLYLTRDYPGKVSRLSNIAHLLVVDAELDQA